MSHVIVHTKAYRYMLPGNVLGYTCIVPIFTTVSADSQRVTCILARQACLYLVYNHNQTLHR